MVTLTNQPQLISETDITKKTSASTSSKILSLSIEKGTTSDLTTPTAETRAGTFNNVYNGPPLSNFVSTSTASEINETTDAGQTIPNPLQNVSNTNQIIIFSTIGGVVFLAFLTFLWCICRKKDSEGLKKGEKIDWTNPRSPIVISPGLRQRRKGWKWWNN